MFNCNSPFHRFLFSSAPFFRVRGQRGVVPGGERVRHRQKAQLGAMPGGRGALGKSPDTAIVGKWCRYNLLLSAFPPCSDLARATGRGRGGYQKPRFDFSLPSIDVLPWIDAVVRSIDRGLAIRPSIQYCSGAVDAMLDWCRRRGGIVFFGQSVSPPRPCGYACKYPG